MTMVPQILREFLLSRMEPFVGENSLFQRASFFTNGYWRHENKTTESKSCKEQESRTTTITTSYSAITSRYGGTVLNRLWQIVFPGMQAKEESSEQETSKQRILDFDFDPLAIGTCIQEVYFHLFSQDLLEVTKDSLNVLRYQSKILLGLQDNEVIKMVKSNLFGMSPSENEVSRDKNNTVTGLTGLVWRTSKCVWKTAMDRLGMNMALPWLMGKTADTSESCCHDDKTALSVSTLLLYEASTNITQTIQDTGEYAITSTADLINEAILLFVPMEILESTSKILQSSLTLASLPTMEVFWELFDYLRIWDFDISEELRNAPDINYVAINDDDFHFVVNIPNLKRPILFIGVR